MPEAHPAFVNSGKKAGLEIWRVEDFEPVPVPSYQYGNFYSGDSYIVLKLGQLQSSRSTWMTSSSTETLSNTATIRYLEGGHASGFNHVTVNPGAEKRLFQIKGKRNVRVRQIMLYVGDKAKSVERLKAISVANQIRDQDHSGRGNIDIIVLHSPGLR
ncbi:unnamed protein product [Leptidea sinapis]|uniref:Gelsolin-like domain-containing protein n=1 Tax=Leptidea sinapis TaxID=189913 RepID=A0A5E4QP57_9NEOP|nr:unnamed protein product [Leptidea sinapis]